MTTQYPPPPLRGKLHNLANAFGAEFDGHGNRVAAMVPPLMEAAGLTHHNLSSIVLGARLHDIGKKLVPTDILCAPTPLSRNERNIIANHPSDGLKLVKDLVGEVPDDIAECILHHHEQWDGSGYPDGLYGYNIPLPARIVAIADVIDALASPRVYKPALDFPSIRCILKEGRGTHFDPSLTDAALNNYDAIILARANAPASKAKVDQDVLVSE